MDLPTRWEVRHKWLNFAKLQGHFENDTMTYLKLPSCKATKTASYFAKKNRSKRHKVYTLANQKWWIFENCHKTWMLHRSVLNFVINEIWDPALSDKIVEADISRRTSHVMKKFNCESFSLPLRFLRRVSRKL